MDDKIQRGSQDRSRVSSTEDYELEYLRKKYDVDVSIVRKAISEVGPKRIDVEEFLLAYKKGNSI